MNLWAKRFLATPFRWERIWKGFLGNPSVCVVLSFHRVLPVDHPDYCYTEPELVIANELFASYIEILAELTEVLSAKDFIEWTFGRRKAKRTASLITFDDGWKDVSNFAVEPLRKLGLPAVVFVCPGSIESNEKSLWFEKTYRLLLKAAELGRLQQSTEFSNNPRKIAKRTLEKLKRESIEERDRVIYELQESFGDADEPTRILDWGDLKKLLEIGIEPHCHTLAHEILTNLSESEVRSNLQESRKLIEERLGFSPTLLAYPNGEADGRVAEVARGCGFEAGFTTEDMRLVRGRVNPFFVPRRVMSQTTVPTKALFVWKLLGLP